MPWSCQNIEEAIQTSKTKNAIFVVYVQDDTKQTSLNNVLECGEVTNLLRSNQFVAIRISSSSQSYRDFVSIYQLVPIPSLFFIGQNGWPLEIITCELPESAIIQRIKRLLGQCSENEEKSNRSSESLVHVNVLDENIAITSTTSISIPSTSSTIAPEILSDDVASKDVTDGLPSTGIPSGLIQSKDANGKEQTSHASTNLKNIHNPTPSSITNTFSDFDDTSVLSKPSYDASSMDSGFGSVMEPSISNRGTDSSISSIPSDVTLLSEILTEGLDPLESTSVIRNIAQNERADSEAIRRSQHDPVPAVEGEARTQPFPVPLRPVNNLQPAEPPSAGILSILGGWMRHVLNSAKATPNRAHTTHTEVTDRPTLNHLLSRSSQLPASSASTGAFGNPENAHIQFRLPDGSTHSRIFLASCTISEVREYVQNNIPLPFREFGLSTSYPRVEFSEEHLNSTVGELGLAPRSVILIIPGQEVARSAYLSATTGAIWFLVGWPFSAVYAVMAYLNIWLLRGADRAVSDSGHSQWQAEEQSPHEQSSANRILMGARRRMPSGTSSIVQRDGNIYSLSNRQEDSDDENNTWNGNSTQQM